MVRGRRTGAPGNDLERDSIRAGTSAKERERESEIEQTRYAVDRVAASYDGDHYKLQIQLKHYGYPW